MQKILPPGQEDFGRTCCNLLRRVEPVEVDCFLRDGEHKDWCGGCTVIASPGHTPGHISLLMEKDLIVITGDAIALEGGEPVIANPQFSLDIEQADKEKVKDLLFSPGYEASFRYDFGDGWEVRLVCESTDIMTISARELPRVLEGEGYGIIEDCGGPGGLEQLRKAFKKKKGKDYEMYVEWLGVESLDLTTFNKDDINFRLKKLPRVYKDMYEHDLYLTQQSVDLLERKYMNKKKSGWMPSDQS